MNRTTFADRILWTSWDGALTSDWTGVWVTSVNWYLCPISDSTQPRPSATASHRIYQIDRGKKWYNSILHCSQNTWLWLSNDSIFFFIKMREKERKIQSLALIQSWCSTVCWVYKSAWQKNKITNLQMHIIGLIVTDSSMYIFLQIFFCLCNLKSN